MREIEQGAGGGILGRRVAELEARQAELSDPDRGRADRAGDRQLGRGARGLYRLSRPDPVDAAGCRPDQSDRGGPGPEGNGRGSEELTPAEGRGRIDVAVGIRGVPMRLVAVEAANRAGSREQARNATIGIIGSGGLSPPSRYSRRCASWPDRRSLTKTLLRPFRSPLARVFRRRPGSRGPAASPNERPDLPAARPIRRRWSVS
jgi:hypothetical protein